MGKLEERIIRILCIKVKKDYLENITSMSGAAARTKFLSINTDEKYNKLRNRWQKNIQDHSEVKDACNLGDTMEIMQERKIPEQFDRKSYIILKSI